MSYPKTVLGRRKLKSHTSREIKTMKRIITILLLSVCSAGTSKLLAQENFSSNFQTVCPSQIVRLVADNHTTLSAYTWSITPSTGWTYVGGTGSNSAYPQISFATIGTYDISLTIGTGQPVSKTKYITVINQTNYINNYFSNEKNWVVGYNTQNQKKYMFTENNVFSENHSVNISQPSITYSNSNGSINFTIDNFMVYNRHRIPMKKNPWNLMNKMQTNISLNESRLVIPVPGCEDRYYLFHLNRDPSSGTTGVVRNNLYYTIIDMNGDNGLGEINSTNANILISNDVSCFIGIAPHCNGKDFWLISHSFSSHTFRTYLINSNVSTTPVTTPFSGILTSYFDNLTVSSDGSKIGYQYQDNSAIALVRVQIFNFNGSNGTLSLLNTYNPTYTNTSTGNLLSGCEFSPDGNYFYTTEMNGGITQINLNTGVQAQLSGISYNPSGGTLHINDIELGPDNRIYYSYSISNSSQSGYLARIGSPNNPASSLNIDNQFVNHPMIRGLSENSLLRFQKFHQASLGINDNYYVCQGQTQQIILSNRSSYTSIYLLDQNNNSTVVTQDNLGNLSPGRYQLKLQIGSCYRYITFTIQEVQMEFDISGPSPIICGKNESFGINWYQKPVGNITYNWSISPTVPITSGQGTNNIIFDFTNMPKGSSYIIQCTTSLNGCTASKSFNVNNDDLDCSLFHIAGPDKTLCSGSDLTYSLTGPITSGAILEWSIEPGSGPPSIISQTGNEVKINFSGTNHDQIYKVKCTLKIGACECIKEFDVDDQFNPISSLPNSKVLNCGEEFEFDAGQGFDSYLWSDGKTTRKNIVLGGTGNYTLSVTVILGTCSTSFNVQVTGDICCLPPNILPSTINQYVYSGTGVSNPLTMVMDVDENTYSLFGSFNITKTTASGNKVFNYNYGRAKRNLPSEYPIDMVLDETDQSLALITNVVASYILLYKLGSDGSISWIKSLYSVSEGTIQASAIIQTKDVTNTPDGYLIAGQISYPNNSDIDIIIVKTDLNGNMVWKKHIPGLLNEHSLDIIQTFLNNGTTSPNGYMLLGRSLDMNGVFQKSMFIKLNLSGIISTPIKQIDEELFSLVQIQKNGLPDGIIYVGKSSSDNLLVCFDAPALGAFQCKYINLANKTFGINIIQNKTNELFYVLGMENDPISTYLKYFSFKFNSSSNISGNLIKYTNIRNLTNDHNCEITSKGLFHTTITEGIQILANSSSDFSLIKADLNGKAICYEELPASFITLEKTPTFDNISSSNLNVNSENYENTFTPKDLLKICCNIDPCQTTTADVDLEVVGNNVNGNVTSNFEIINISWEIDNDGIFRDHLYGITWSIGTHTICTKVIFGNGCIKTFCKSITIDCDWSNYNYEISLLGDGLVIEYGVISNNLPSGTTYEWELPNGGTHSGQWGGIILNGGYYTFCVTITLPNGCKKRLCQSYQHGLPPFPPPGPGNNNEQMKSYTFIVSPNPSSDIFHLRYSGITPLVQYNIELYDILGQAVISTIVVCDKFLYNLDLTELATGVYTLKIEANGYVQFVKLIKN